MSRDSQPVGKAFTPDSEAVIPREAPPRPTAPSLPPRPLDEPWSGEPDRDDTWRLPVDPLLVLPTELAWESQTVAGDAEEGSGWGEPRRGKP